MGNWNNQTALEAIEAAFAGKIISTEETYGLLNIEVSPADAYEVIAWLKNHDSLKMQFLTDLCAVHYPDKEGNELGVIYHLHSLQNNFRIRVKAFMPKDQAEIASLIPLFKGANWMERETFDFYGIQFTGHPDLRRILNMDDMDYHPLLKEYALEDETRTDKQDKFFGR